MKKWKVLSSKMAFEHKFMKVRQDTVELPNGRTLDDYFVWLEGNIVLVVPVTAEGKFVLVRQYKHAAGDILLEFPAGYADEKEAMEAAAKRELEEETGYTCPSLTFLGAVTNNPTKAAGKVHIYLGRNAERTHEQHFDENEEIEVILMEKDALLAAITSGKIWVSGTIAAAFLALEKLQTA